MTSPEADANNETVSVTTKFEAMKAWTYEHRRPLMAIFALVAVIALIIGLSLSWFVANNSLSTVGKIQTPVNLKVLGPNQLKTEPLEIAYDPSRDTKDEYGNVTIRRAFCVQSNNEKYPGSGGQAFELQVANTTNISGLTINVYRVTVNDPTNTSGDVVGLDGLNRTYSWSKSGEAINLIPINADSLGKALDKNDPTFQGYTNVQQNARPLYRYAAFDKTGLDGYDANERKANDATNFIIECTWNETSNAKETDMVYLIARTSEQEK